MSAVYAPVPKLTREFIAKMEDAARRGHTMRGQIRGNGHPGSPREWMLSCQCRWESGWGRIADVRAEGEKHADEASRVPAGPRLT